MKSYSPSQTPPIYTLDALSKKEIPETLILVPDLSAPGGVTNYYRTLKLDSIEHISYFEINKWKNKTLFASITNLFVNYFKFFFLLLSGKFKLVVINPSLDLGKSFHRDLVFILIAHVLNKKTIVFFRGWFDPYEERIKKSKFKLFLFRVSYAKVDHYIVLGTIFKRKLIKLGVPSTTGFSIETTVADSTWLNYLNLKQKQLSFQKEIKILFLSRIEEEKGLFIAIKAFQIFFQTPKGRSSNLTIAGDGPALKAAKDFVKENKISNIAFLGPVAGEGKMEVLLSSHIMILPSFTEGLPNVILEGMLYGMAIISRVTGGIPEIVKQGINGYLSDSYDPEVYANFLLEIASNESLYKSISETNNRIGLKTFTNEIVKERILKIIEDVGSYKK